jgi:DNA-binding CsgD family transcriptional regulator
VVEVGLDGFRVFQRLNPRQKRCAALLVSGVLSNTAIAKHLGTTRSTVANVISAIMDVCGVDSRLNLLLFIARTPGLEQKLLEFEAQQRGLQNPSVPFASSDIAPNGQGRGKRFQV